jgi:hypothetical protein
VSSYSEERDALGRQTQELACALARELGVGWGVVHPRTDMGWEPNWAELVRAEDGATINIRVGGYLKKGRVVFRGDFPRFKDGTTYSARSGDKRPEISCSDKRSPVMLATEIRRRLFPAYEPYVDQYEANASEAVLASKRIAEVIGGTAEPDSYFARRRGGAAIGNTPESVSRVVVRPAWVSSVSGEHDMEVDFEVHGLDVDIAREVLEIIHKRQDEKAAQKPVRVVDELASDPEEEESTQESFLAAVAR